MPKPARKARAAAPRPKTAVPSESKFLLIDCETTGLPLTRYFTPDDVSGWPRLVQLAWGVFSSSGEPEEMHCHIIKPEGFVIPADSTRIHGISHATAVREGRRLAEVLDELLVAISGGVTAVVAHNLEYDFGVVGGELVRLKRPLALLEFPGICTMKTTTELCRLPRPGGFGFKWPTLVELHGCLFGQGYEGAHDAESDLHACARCFFRLLSLGHYEIS